MSHVTVWWLRINGKNISISVFWDLIFRCPVDAVFTDCSHKRRASGVHKAPPQSPWSEGAPWVRGSPKRTKH
jgi:hypothetical protein